MSRSFSGSRLVRWLMAAPLVLMVTGPLGAQSAKPVTKVAAELLPFADHANSPAGLKFAVPCAADTTLPELTQVAQIRDLPPREASRGYPVRVTGVLTYYDPSEFMQFVQDDSAGIYIVVSETANLDPLLAHGQKVDIEGFSGPGDYAPVLSVARTRNLGNSPFPLPMASTVQSLMTGSQDSQWVTLKGVIRSQTVENDRTVLRLWTGDAGIRVTVPRATKAPAPMDFVDAAVEIHGVCSTTFNNRRRLQGVQLHVPDWTQIEVQAAGSKDPFALPMRPIHELLEFHSGTSGLHRSRTSGTVTLALSDGSFFLQDASTGILVQPGEATMKIAAGTPVEIAGFPATVDRLPVLQEAITKPLGGLPPIEPVHLTTESSLNEALHATLVRLDGRVIAHSKRPAGEILTVQFGESVIDVIMTNEAAPVQSAMVVSGSSVRLTGVYVAQLDDSRKIRSFRLLLRSPEDIVLLSRPPWWTLRNTLWASGGLAAVLFGSLAWVSLLRRQVRRRTVELSGEVEARKQREAELQQTQELLNSVVENLPITVFLKEAAELRFVLWNKAGENLLGSTSEELMGKNDYDFFPGEEADRFRANDEETLAKGHLLEIAEEPIQTLHQGMRILRTRKIPIFDRSGKPTHLLGISEDITERKRAEAELEKLHTQLVDTSRRAGMAEIATNVLHNVGNVLNSVNISTGLIVESVKKSKASKLARVVDLLREHADDLGAFVTDDSRGKQLPAYLAQLSEHLTADQEAIVSELDSLRRNVEHIKEIVAMQQSYATFGGVKEIINVVNLVEDSLRMTEGALSRHRVEVIREFDNVQPINLEKHKILQILVNLLRNAKHACKESNRADKRLTVRVANGDGRVRISVIDNGIGIPPENLARIFNHGFTTRKGGHGFGLHSGALAAKEMGGSLTLHSDGPGKGSAFTLELPCPTRENSNE